MRKIFFSIAISHTFLGFSQNLLMQNGTFNRCTPDKFFDSGGEFGNYGDDENFTTTICPQNAGEFIALDFLSFRTETNLDIMTIYDGDDTSANVIGTYSGPNGLSGMVSVTPSNALKSWFVIHYELQADTQAKTNAIANPEAYTNTSNPQQIFVSITNTSTSCFISTQSSFSPQSGGNYQVTVTNTITGCDIPVLTEVLESQPPTSLDLNVLTTAFADSHAIQATAMGNSLDGYQYNLDGGPWQDDGLFTNVSLGEHIITARDKTGCGYISRPIHVIDYPLYFTPNGDGNHDTWNITDTQNQLSSVKIYIFDRFGKFIKQISPRGEGWDGTYNGKLMPTNDYWFTITYNEPNTNTPKEFKAHFTLKR